MPKIRHISVSLTEAEAYLVTTMIDESLRRAKAYFGPLAQTGAPQHKVYPPSTARRIAERATNVRRKILHSLGGTTNAE